MDWLMQRLRMLGGQGGPFGGIGGGSQGPAANNGLPPSGLGPGANATPTQMAQNPNGGSPTSGLWNPSQNSRNNLFNTAMGMMKPAPIQPAQFAPPPAAPQANLQLGGLLG